MPTCRQGEWVASDWWSGPLSSLRGCFTVGPPMRRDPRGGYSPGKGIGNLEDVPVPASGPNCDPAQPTQSSPAPHDYEVVGAEYDSLANGGSYDILRCRRCGRIAYSPIAD